MVAVLYDVHGNLPALEAVLADATEAGAERYVLGGDYALFGPWPDETVARLHELDATWIRGNGERWTGNPAAAPDDEVVQAAIAASRDELGEAMVEELLALPEQYVTGDARYCHGSPPSDVRSFFPEPADDEDERVTGVVRAVDGVSFEVREGETLYVHASPLSDMRSFFPEPADDEDELLAGVHEERLVFGHTHLQFRRRTAAGGTELVNPGSVGMPFDGDPRSGYALLTGDGDVELRRGVYDHEASAAAVRERFPGFGETVARRIEQAAFAV
jgi:diadenosine tetraphosphatase ApaH/serine/threonine PP2A family protein phosphatase